MTEADWNGCTDPDLMLDFLHGMASTRKLRLFACGCCRMVQHLFGDGHSLHALEVAERLADEVVIQTEVNEAEGQAWAAGDSWPRRMVWEAVQEAWPEPAAWATWALWAASQKDAPAIAANLLRDLFGPLPSRPLPSLSASLLGWNDGTVVKLATAIYEDRRFEDMPVLGDALEDAGCQDQEILRHCRQQEAVHVRGCWVLDLLLGKE